MYHHVVVQLADDADCRDHVHTVFNNDQDNSLGLGFGKDSEYVEKVAGKFIDAGGVIARYVRLYSQGNTTDERNHYASIEVHGRRP